MKTKGTEKRFSLRLSEESLKQVQERAKSLQMSINAYLLYAARKEMEENGIGPIREAKAIPRRLIIHLSEEQREEIGRRAADRGLSIRQYMDWLVNKRSDVDIRIAVTDFEAVEKQVDELITVFNGVASVIIRSGKVYEGELKTLLSSMQEINEYFKKLYREEHDNRYRLYAECRKRVFEDIDKARFIKRNRVNEPK